MTKQFLEPLTLDNIQAEIDNMSDEDRRYHGLKASWEFKRKLSESPQNNEIDYAGEFDLETESGNTGAKVYEFRGKQPALQAPIQPGSWAIDNNGNLELEDGGRIEVRDAEIRWVQPYPKTGKANSYKVKLATDEFMWESRFNLSLEFGKKCFEDILRCASSDMLDTGTHIYDIVVCRKGDWYNTYSR